MTFKARLSALPTTPIYFEKTWTFPTDQNTILIKDFKTNHNLLKSDSNLLLINDNRRAKLDLNLDLSQFNFLKVDLSAYLNVFAGDFILNLNWNIVPYAYFKDWQVANQSEPIVLPTELDMINAYAFSNSGLKTFVWSDPTQNNHQILQIDNYAFDQDVSINLNLNTTIALKAFSQSDQIANTITFNQQQIQAWIKPYYDVQNQILDLSTINRFDLGLLRLLIIAFQDRDLRVLKLPALNEVDRAWFTIANHVDQLIIN